MSDDEKEEGGDFDYEAATITALTLRINTPLGEWLSDDDLEIVSANMAEAIAASGEGWAHEYMWLAMMNTAWLALSHLERVSGESQGTWLARIARDLRNLG